MTQPIEEVRLREETLAHLKEVMRDAVREGLRDLLTDEETTAKLYASFWAGGLAMLQQQAAQHAGRFVLGGLFGLLRKVSMFIVIGSAVYAFGGWTALAAFVKGLFSQGGGS